MIYMRMADKREYYFTNETTKVFLFKKAKKLTFNQIKKNLPWENYPWIYYKTYYFPIPPRERKRGREKVDGIALKYALDYLSSMFDQTIILTNIVLNAKKLLDN